MCICDEQLEKRSCTQKLAFYLIFSMFYFVWERHLPMLYGKYILYIFKILYNIFILFIFYIYKYIFLNIFILYILKSFYSARFLCVFFKCLLCQSSLFTFLPLPCPLFSHYTVNLFITFSSFNLLSLPCYEMQSLPWYRWLPVSYLLWLHF